MMNKTTPFNTREISNIRLHSKPFLMMLLHLLILHPEKSGT
jgi:hypothetical protein